MTVVPDLKPLSPAAVDDLVPLRDTDARQLIALITGCYAEYEHLGVVHDPKELDSDLDAYASYIRKRDGEAFGLWQGGILLASGAYGRTGEGGDLDASYEIKRFYMQKDARGAGFATAFLTFLETRLKAKGICRVTLWSDTRFTRAHRFYEREGYRKTDRTRALHDPSNTIEYFFEKSL